MSSTENDPTDKNIKPTARKTLDARKNKRVVTTKAPGEISAIIVDPRNLESKIISRYARHYVKIERILETAVSPILARRQLIMGKKFFLREILEKDTLLHHGYRIRITVSAVNGADMEGTETSFEHQMPGRLQERRPTYTKRAARALLGKTPLALPAPSVPHLPAIVVASQTPLPCEVRKFTRTGVLANIIAGVLGLASKIKY